MPYSEINGINIRYEVRGSGAPLLMMAPGGFDSTIEKWTTSGIWAGMKPLETLTSRYTCIAYDRREAGLSGGRVERVSWTTYAHEAKGLLDVLGIPRAFVIGGCMGCSTASAFAVTYPEATLGMILHWPVGGVRWRQNGLERFQSHVDFVKQNGLDAVVELAREGGSFWAEPKAGPWASTICADESFAGSFANPGPGTLSGYGGPDGADSLRPRHRDRPGTDGADGPPNAVRNHPRRRRGPRHQRRPLPARVPGGRGLPRRAGRAANPRHRPPVDYRVHGV